MTQDIKELLELAALACGVEVTPVEIRPADRSLPVEFIGYRAELSQVAPRGWWNPHLDDGDGARMEEKLSINLSWDDYSVTAVSEHRLVLVNERRSDHNGNRQAARRMASLRVAAEIGRRMKT